MATREDALPVVDKLRIRYARPGVLQLRSIDDAMKFADLLAKSTIIPESYRNRAADIVVAIMHGAEVGLAPVQALQSIAVINGRPVVWGDALLGLVMASGLLESIEEADDGKTATCTVVRKGDLAMKVTRSFSMEQAQRAGLAERSGPWKQYPGRMRQMRARTFCLRDAFADVLKGLTSREEAEDIGDVVDHDTGEVQQRVRATPRVVGGGTSRLAQALQGAQPVQPLNVPGPRLDPPRNIEAPEAVIQDNAPARVAAPAPPRAPTPAQAPAAPAPAPAPAPPKPAPPRPAPAPQPAPRPQPAPAPAAPAPTPPAAAQAPTGQTSLLPDMGNPAPPWPAAEADTEEPNGNTGGPMPGDSQERLDCLGRIGGLLHKAALTPTMTVKLLREHCQVATLVALDDVMDMDKLEALENGLALLLATRKPSHRPEPE